MPTPNGSSQLTTFTGSTGNAIIDAMIVTSESMTVPVAQRPTLAGVTAIKWGGAIGTGITLTYSFVSPGAVFASNYPPGYTNVILTVSDATKAEFRAALQMWERYTNVSFQEVTETSTSVGDIRIGYTGSHPQAGFAGAEAAPPSVSNGARAGDIWFTTPSVSFNTAIHELGHAVFNLTDVSTSAGMVGATLPDELNARTYTLMSYSTVPGAGPGDDLTPTFGSASMLPTTPMILDILAAQYLYGANMAYRAGDDVYTFNSSQTYFETIWDAGGIDTFDASSATGNLTLDLRPGTMSNVGSVVILNTQGGQTNLTHTVGIAYGAIIENAIGGSGADTMHGNSAGNLLMGNGGADTLYGNEGGDVLFGGSGVDWLDGGNGIDTVSAANDAAGSTIHLAGGWAQDGWGHVDQLVSIENANGSAFNDTLIGSAGLNTILGNGGNDWIDDVGTTADQFFGGAGDDTLWGQGGDDMLAGEDGIDTLSGGDGNDTLSGGADYDWMDGGAGDDVLEGGAGVNVLLGGIGTDLASYAGATSPLWVNMAAGVYSAAGVWDVFFESIEGVRGGSGNDSLFGNASDNRLEGANGDDALIGDLGHDTLIGGAGSDWIVGGDGNDRLIGGDGVDVLTGGVGADTFDLGTAAGWDVAFDFNTAEDRFSLGGLQWLGFLTIDADGDGQTDDTLLGYAGGNFVALNVTGLSLSQWNALIVGVPAAEDAEKFVSDPDPEVLPAIGGFARGHGFDFDAGLDAATRGFRPNDPFIVPQDGWGPLAA